MKKLTYSFAAAMLAISLAGCNGNNAGKKAEKFLSEKAKATAVPQSVGAGSSLTSCEYKDKVLSYRIETTADSLAAINIDTLRANTIRNWNTNLNTQEILKQLKAAGASVRYTYVSGNDSIVTTLTTEDFK